MIPVASQVQVLATTRRRAVNLAATAHRRLRPSDAPAIPIARRGLLAARPPDYSLLSQRIARSSSDSATLTCLILDTMLPRQRLEYHFQPPVSRLLSSGDTRVERGDSVGILGMDLQTGEILKRGVEARIESMSAYRANNGYFSSHALSGSTHSTRGYMALETCLVGGRRFEIVDFDGPWPPEDRWVVAEVKWAAEEEKGGSTAAAIVLAEELGPLVTEWIELVKSGQRERTEGQLERILKDLGPMPEAEYADDRAFWVASLINPIPALGVAREIRHKILAAEGGKERVEWARQALLDSIKRCQQRPPGPFEVEARPRSGL